MGKVRSQKALVELTRNSYEPDVCFWGTAKSATITEDQLYYPAPDFIAEVLPKSTKKLDREIKFADYMAHAVAEYWLVDPTRQEVEQYRINDESEAYELVAKLNLKASVSSFAVLGFEIPVRAIFDKAAQLELLRGWM